MFDLQGILGSCAEGLANSVAVMRAPLQRPKNQHIESSLNEFDAISIWFSFAHMLWKIVYHSVSARGNEPFTPIASVKAQTLLPIMGVVAMVVTGPINFAPRRAYGSKAAAIVISAMVLREGRSRSLRTQCSFV